MRFKLQRNHMVDFMFPIALFFVFAVSAIVVILLAAGIYESTTQRSMLNDTSRTTLSYISEKIHQNDAEGEISLGEFDSCPALIMEHGGEMEGYTTYIYVYENELRELLATGEAQANASVGKSIMAVEDFDMEELEGGLFRFSCTNADGHEVSTIVGVRSAADRDARQ